uniref:PH domain-containing protein n=1 Tax=Ceratitis capitata TaxID=7213 RepID=W8AKF0_CERCA
MLVTSNNNSANSNNSYNKHTNNSGSNSNHSMTTTNSTSTSTPTPGCSSTSSNHTLLEPTAAWAQLPNLGNSSSSSLAAAAVGGGGPCSSRPPSRAPSILDSPTLARVERARLRLEATTLQQQQQHHHHHMYTNGSSSGSNATTLNREGSLERSILDPKRNVATPQPPWQQMWSHMKRLSHNSKVNSTSTLTFTLPKTDTSNANSSNGTKCMVNGVSGLNGLNGLYPDRTASLKNAMLHTATQSTQQVYYKPDMQSLLAGRIPVASMTGPIKRGLLWQQRDRLFSRWKERYFVLTRDYLHCFKRASGSANERASDMGQFIFKVKLVDVEKVEWLNRRSYSAIGLLLGREGRILLRCDNGLEDWFELLEECTLFSKQRRHALKIAQGPRSRASLAAPVSHAALESQHFGLGSSYSSALEDWLMTNGSGIGGRNKIATGCGFGSTGNNPFLFSDSVPDLSALNSEHHPRISGYSTNHSTPQKIPYSRQGENGNHSRYSNGYVSQNNSFTNNSASVVGGGGPFDSPRRIFINKDFSANQVVDEEADDEEKVELRRPHAYGGGAAVGSKNAGNNNDLENGNVVDGEWLYRKPRAPTDMRHSVQPMLPTNNNYNNANNSTTKIPVTDLDHSAHDSGLDTPPSTNQRPSSYREIITRTPVREANESVVRSSHGNLLNGSFRTKQITHLTNNLNQVNALHSSHLSVQERILQMRNEENRWGSLKSEANRYSHNALYDQNKNPYPESANQSPQRTPFKKHSLIGYGRSISHDTNGTMNGNAQMKGSSILRERFQHPALAAIKAFY